MSDRLEICAACGALEDGQVGQTNEQGDWFCSPDCAAETNCCPLCSEPFDDPAEQNHQARQYRALLRRDWAMRVLDAWRSLDSRNTWWMTESVASREPRVMRAHDGMWLAQSDATTPHAARLAAAKAVYPELPADVRTELGEHP